MYGKTADKTHLHSRTGSHATKGSGRGTVWWNTHEPAPGISRELKRAVSGAISQFSRIIKIRDEAFIAGDIPTTRECHLAMRKLKKNFKKLAMDGLIVERKKK